MCVLVTPESVLDFATLHDSLPFQNDTLPTSSTLPTGSTLFFNTVILVQD